MFTLESLVSSPIVEHLGWMLVHAVWQGAFVALALAGIHHLLHRHIPAVRYAVSCVALVLLVVLPVGTTLLLQGSSAVPSAPVPAMQESGTEAPHVVALLDATSREAAPTFAWTHPTTWDEAAGRMLRPWLPWLVAAWALGLLWAMGRLIGGALHVRRMRRRSTPAPEPWPDRLARLADRLGIRASVPLRVSTSVDGPMVIGWLRPMVLVPAGMLTGLPPGQVEALLVHELAHIRRHDVLVGWIQAVVEAVLFFHPAAWWISAQIRRERELCCDDVAVATGTNTLTYAQALTSVAEQQVRPSLALTASEGPLLRRIRRLVAPQPVADGWSHRLSLGAAAVLLATLPILVAACASQQETTADPTAATPPSPAVAEADSSDEDRSVVVTEDGDETVFRVERDSGDVEVYGLRVSEDSTGTRVRVRPRKRHRRVLRLRDDSLGHSFVFSMDDDSTRRGTFNSEDNAGTFVFRLGRDSLGPRLRADTLLAKLRAPQIEFSRDRLRTFMLPSTPDPPHVFFDDTIRVDPDLDRFRFWFHEDGDTLRGSFERDMERLREWREEWEEEWGPDREELERRLRRWHEEHADSLERKAEAWVRRFREGYDEHAEEWELRNREQMERWLHRHEHRADSLDAHARRLQERLESEQWERQLQMLREQAERLREQAERLEERARELERDLSPPDSTE